MKINISLLSFLFDEIIRKLHTEAGDIIELGNSDYYWTILPPDWTDMTKSPTLSVGSFLDDLESLKKQLNQEPFLTYVDIDRVGSLLHLISERLNPVEE